MGGKGKISMVNVNFSKTVAFKDTVRSENVVAVHNAGKNTYLTQIFSLSIVPLKSVKESISPLLCAG
jgi:hypothetical protein